MALFGLLGPIEFETLTSPTELNATLDFTYATHDVVEDRPRLQWLSDDLEKIELTMLWHAAFCNPQDQYDQLRAAAGLHPALPLVFGTGVFRGWFVITQIVETIRTTADDGSLIEVQCTVQLTEYAMSPTLEEIEAPAAPAPAIAPLRVEPDLPVFTNAMGEPIEPHDFTRHWYACLKTLGIGTRGLYCTKDTFLSTAPQAGVKIAWLEQQTGVSYVTLRRHYARWIRPEHEGELVRFAANDAALFGTEMSPEKRVAGDNDLQVMKIAANLKWSQGDSNPCYRRERPAS